MNRVVRMHDLNMFFVPGPAHGGPAVVANAYLEGTYSELYYFPGRGRYAAAVLAVLFSGRDT
jgi:xylulose-5-phosphate/fructose-6-phosphate phosphoketolase